MIIKEGFLEEATSEISGLKRSHLDEVAGETLQALRAWRNDLRIKKQEWEVQDGIKIGF